MTQSCRGRRTMFVSLSLMALLTGPTANAEVPEATVLHPPRAPEIQLYSSDALPRVGIALVVRAGRGSDLAGKQGTAHLVEHLMTEELPQMSSIDEQGLLNRLLIEHDAVTDRDMTVYYYTGPSKYIEIMMWLLSNHLLYSIPHMTQPVFDATVKIVQNEDHRTVGGVPYQRAYVRLLSLLLGEQVANSDRDESFDSDLESITLDDAVAFWKTWYRTDSVSLVVIGEADKEEVKRLGAKYFGEMMQANTANSKDVAVVSPTGQRLSEVDDVVKATGLTFGWVVPAIFAPGDAEMELIPIVLGGGKHSVLGSALLGTKLAQTVDCWHAQSVRGSILACKVVLLLGVDGSKAMAVIDAAITQFLDKGPSDADLANSKKRWLLGIASSFETMQRALYLLAVPGTYGATTGSIGRLSDAIRAISSQSMRQVANEWLTPNHRALVTTNPRAQ